VVADQRLGGLELLVQTMRTTVAALGLRGTMAEGEGRPLPASAAGARQLGRWDSKPPLRWSGDRGHGQEGTATCDFFVPVVTASARPYPQVLDAVRTLRGPAATLSYRTMGRRPPCFRVGHGGQCVAGHRRGRRPCSTGSDERSLSLAPASSGCPSTISITSTRPAGIGPCMSPGRTGICASDG
jgi:hypothetical protein